MQLADNYNLSNDVIQAKYKFKFNYDCFVQYSKTKSE